MRCHVTMTAVVIAAALESTAAPAETLVVRARDAKVRPAAALGTAAVGESFCNDGYCTVLPATPAHRDVLAKLERAGTITLEALPDANKLFLQRATWDGDRRAFDADFALGAETVSATSAAQAYVVFKAPVEPAWIKALEARGVKCLEPIPTQGYLTFGSRETFESLVRTLPFVRDVVEVPAGVKRFNLDTRSEGDDDGPAPTTVTVVAAEQAFVADILRSTAGRDVPTVGSTGTTTTLSAELTRQEGINLADFPEVVSVRRDTIPGAPSDERSNRIVAGQWQTPGSSWPMSLGSNNGSPRFWDGYLQSVASAGINLSN